MSQGYPPPQPPYGQQPYGTNPQGPFYQDSQSLGQQPYGTNPQGPFYQDSQSLGQQPYNPQYQQTIFPAQQPPQFPQMQPKKQKGPKEVWRGAGKAGKCGIISVCVILVLSMCICASALSAARSSSSTASTSQASVADASTEPTSTVEPTPTPTEVPTPTPTPMPTKTVVQQEADYKASTKDLTVSAIDKDGSADQGTDVHFTSTILNFVKDSTGITAGANVTDETDSSVIQVLFTPGTDINQLNQDDILEVWGTDQGAVPETNAYGGAIQEVVIAAQYMNDQTTSYQVNT